MNDGVDAVAQQNWEAYSEFKAKMFRMTSTPWCPWVVINGNDKDVARKEAMRYVISQIDYPKKGSATKRIVPDPDIVDVIHNTEDASRYFSSHKEH